MVWTELKGGRKRQAPAWEIIPYPENCKVAFKASRTFGGHNLPFEGHNPVNELLRFGFYTHAQRVFWACRLLFDRPHIAELIARRFPEIIVDEAQDTNVWLLILLNFLREKGTKIALIGDPDQCIYEFSMADATSLPALREKWNIPEKPLSQSFRCNNQIAAAVRNIGGNSFFAGSGMARMSTDGPLSSGSLQQDLRIALQSFNGPSNEPQSMERQVQFYVEHTNNSNLSVAR